MLHSPMIPKDTFLFEANPPASPIKSIASPLLIFAFLQPLYPQPLPNSCENKGGGTPSAHPLLHP